MTGYKKSSALNAAIVSDRLSQTREHLIVIYFVLERPAIAIFLVGLLDLLVSIFSQGTGTFPWSIRF